VTALDVAEDAAEPEKSPDEQFLSLVVLCNPRDRINALDIRRKDGAEAALAFMRSCNISNETFDGTARKDACNEAIGAFYAILGLAKTLNEQNDDTRSLSVCHMIVKEYERLIGVLDSPAILDGES